MDFERVKKAIEPYFGYILCAIAIIAFFVEILPQIAIHGAWADEANAWNIAREMGPLEVLKYMKYEGHLFVWFFLIMPFAKAGFWYPYSMHLINLGFILGAFWLLWRYSPFNSIIKALISCSIIFKITGFFARCYGVGIFFLFSVCALYKKRLKHPLLYSSLISLAANTSVMALIGAFAFGFLFLFDLKKLSKKDLCCSLIIFALCGALIFFQLGNPTVPFYVNDLPENHGLTMLISCILRHGEFLNAFGAGMFLAAFCAFLWAGFKFGAKKQAGFLLFTVLGLLFIFLKVFPGSDYHFVFIPLYLIIAMWLALNDNPEILKTSKYLNLFFILFCTGIFLFPPDWHYMQYKYSDSHTQIRAELLRTEYEGQNIYVFPSYSHFHALYPYFEKKNVHFFNSEAEPFGTKQWFLDLWLYQGIDLNKIKARNEDKEAILAVETKNVEEFLEKIKAQNLKAEILKETPETKLYSVKF